MNKFQQVLLVVWREACRHIEIKRSTQTITSLLLDDMPLAQLLIKRIDTRRHVIETVALGIPNVDEKLDKTSAACTSNDLEQLEAWADEERIFRRSGNHIDDRQMSSLLEGFSGHDVIAGPLRSTDGLLGILILVAAEDKTFTARHEKLAEVLLDPFAVAVSNDLQLREMASLKLAVEAENSSLLRRLGRKRLDETIVGDQTGLREVMERVELVASSDAPVLIFGETGTGKELIARAIHTRSTRAQGPVLRVNCGAIPPELIDSELFGHERGAFTGAVDTRKGWFERADGGTLFLDEIGELPLAAQVRLLRILQDGWMERVGSELPIHVDVRMVAATHRDMAEMVSTGEFRADLWYRIAVFPLVLPPLRERREDIPALAAHFARRAATRFGLTETLPTPEDLRLLSAYSWPGNIRELGTVINRAAILGNGKRLEVSKALGVERSAVPQTMTKISVQSSTPSRIAPLEDAIRAHIEAALAITNGQVEGPNGAAALLEINPNTLRGRMRKLKIDWRLFRNNLNTNSPDEL